MAMTHDGDTSFCDLMFSPDMENMLNKRIRREFPHKAIVCTAPAAELYAVGIGGVTEDVSDGVPDFAFPDLIAGIGAVDEEGLGLARQFCSH